MRTVYQLKPKELLEKRISLCHLDFRSLANAPGEENRHFVECRSVSSIIEKERLSLPSSVSHLQDAKAKRKAEKLLEEMKKRASATISSSSLWTKQAWIWNRHYLLVG
jgi:hypothetical protein